MKYPDEGHEECLLVKSVDSFVHKKFCKQQEFLECEHFDELDQLQNEIAELKEPE